METTICNDMKSCNCMEDGKEDITKSGCGTEATGICSGYMNGVKWFLLFPGIVLASAFLLTYFLNPEAVRIIWIVITGTLFGLGLIFIFLVRFLLKR